MKVILLTLSNLLIILALPGCSDGGPLLTKEESNGFEQYRTQLVDTIKEGISQEEITDRLGPPLIKRPHKEGKEVFIYRLDVSNLPKEDRNTYKENFIDGATILFDSEKKVEQWEFSRGSISQN